MVPVIIGISLGLLIITMVSFLKQSSGKRILYGLILTGIAFLYVGFTWSDTTALIINSVQAAIFVFISFYGVTRSIYILAGGFILHGVWDLVYHLFQDPGLVPPQYDLFCLSVDLVIGIYLLLRQAKYKRASAFLKI